MNPLNRRGFLKLGAVAGAAGAAAACGSGGDTPATGAATGSADLAALTATLRLMCWSGLIEPIVKDYAISEFSKTYGNAKVELEINTNAEWYPKMMATKAQGEYAGGMVNDLFCARGNLDKAWAKPDLANMPNAKSVPAKLNPPGDLGVTVFLTGGGISYNPDKIKSITSWTDMYRPEYKGRVAMSDGGFMPFAMASVADGGDPNDIKRGVDIWAKYKDNIGAWAASEGQRAEMVSSGTMWLTPSYGAWAEQERVKGRTLKFAAPEEGMLGFYAAMQIIDGISGQEKALTEALFNQFYSEATQAQFVKQGFFIPARSGVAVPEDIRAQSAAVMTADEAAAKLVQYDPEKMAAEQRELLTYIQRNLK